MYYSKIKELMTQKKLTRQEMAYRLGLTPYGFDQMIKNQSMKVETLEKMSVILKVPIGFWWEEEGGNNYENMNQVLLIDQLKIKDQQIEFLQGLIKKLQ